MDRTKVAVDPDLRRNAATVSFLALLAILAVMIPFTFDQARTNTPLTTAITGLMN